MSGLTAESHKNVIRTQHLTQRVLPAQARGQDTYQTILQTTSRLLERMGFEEITTNLICQEAGLTPPALYRYFSNKYAILKILAERLIQAHQDVIDAWLAGPHVSEIELRCPTKGISVLLKNLIVTTRNFSGGASITLAMRAIPTLRTLHVISIESAATKVKATLQERFPDLPPARRYIAAKLMAEFGSCLMDIVFNEPEHNTDEVLTEGVSFFLAYLNTVNTGRRAAA